MRDKKALAAKAQRRRQAEAQRRYLQTANGRATQKRYRGSAKGRATAARTRERHGKAASAKAYSDARTLILAFKNVPCMDCHKRFHRVCMDFDHRPGEVKLFSVGACKVGRNVLLAEIAKCDVVCSNCHRLRTHVLRTKSKRSPSRKRKFSLPKRRQCRAFGEQLCAALVAADMKPSQFATAMAVSKPTVSSWTNGRYPMAVNQIKKASKILGVGVEMIAGWIHTGFLQELGVGGIAPCNQHGRGVSV